MEPISFKESNLTLIAPGGMPDCSELPVYSTVAAGRGHIDGPYFISKWKLTEAELEALNKTGELWIYVWGVRHPPISAAVEHPFERPFETNEKGAG